VNIDDVACRDLVQRITDLLDGALAPDEERAALAHIDECPGCAAALDQFRRTIDLLGRLPVEAVRSVDPSVMTSLVDAFRARRS